MGYFQIRIPLLPDTIRDSLFKLCARPVSPSLSLSQAAALQADG